MVLNTKPIQIKLCNSIEGHNNNIVSICMGAVVPLQWVDPALVLTSSGVHCYNWRHQSGEPV